MKKINLINNTIVTTIFLLAGYISANAQKLPNKQDVSFRAPAGVKIDGKVNDWGDKFQAFNNATGIFYTMANDNNDLYLVVKVLDPDVINKIVDGGISLTINRPNQNAEKENISITYPVTDNNYRLFFNLRGKRGTLADTSAKFLDSVMIRNNTILIQKCKWIKTSGINGLDSILSIYNEDHIKAVCRFDNKKALTCELSISLKNLGFSTANPKEFNYQIKLNGEKPLRQMTARNQDGSPVVPVPGQPDLIAMFNDDAAQQSAPTFFWAKYVLAKKP